MTLNIKAEKFAKGLKLSDEVKEELSIVSKSIVHRVVGNAANHAQHNRRNTIMTSDIVNLGSIDDTASRHISGTQFDIAIQTELGEGNNFKFSSGVKKTLQLHTEAALTTLITSLQNKEDTEQIRLLKAGVCVQTIPEFAVEMLSFKNAVGAIQKSASPTLITSEKAKVHVQELVSKLASLLAYQAGQQKSKTISDKDIQLASTTWLPHEYAVHAHNAATEALTKYKNSDQKNVGRRSRAGLHASVSGIENLLRTINKNKNVSSYAPVYLAAVIESVVTDLFTNATHLMQAKKKKTFTPAFLNMVIETSSELSTLFKDQLVLE